MVLSLFSATHLFLCQIILCLFADQICFTDHKESSRVLPPGLLDHATLFTAPCGHTPEKSWGGVRTIDGPQEPLREAAPCSFQEPLALGGVLRAGGGEQSWTQPRLEPGHAAAACFAAHEVRSVLGVASAAPQCAWRARVGGRECRGEV